MRTTAIPAEQDVRHLGVLVGDPNSDRIIAVSTSAVFDDRSLPQTFWGVDVTAIDSGFQGHMYTRPNDILIVRVPGNDEAIPQAVITAINNNKEIWKSLTGIELSSPRDPLVLASDHPAPPADCLPENLTWHRGSLLDAAVSRYRDKGEALLAFVLDNRLADALGLLDQRSPALMDQARITSLLMDKNLTMQALQDNMVDCARTYPVNEDTDLKSALSRIPPTGRYVFKPAGGAAGIGVYSNLGRGAPLELISAHLDQLKRNDQLPRRFQIQEFLPGAPYGVTASFGKDGAFGILEIHRQSIDGAGRFTGGRWTPALQAAEMESATALCYRLTAVGRPPFLGLICLDIIDRKVIEINPRLTASAPIAHVLSRQDQISRHLGSGFRIRQIDLNTKLFIPYEFIRNGTLRQLIEVIWKERGVLVLPQGLNPFGDSRCVLINDDDQGTAQRTLIQRIEE